MVFSTIMEALRASFVYPTKILPLAGERLVFLIKPSEACPFDEIRGNYGTWFRWNSLMKVESKNQTIHLAD